MTDEPVLSAADLITHNLIDWHEAVAIVQGVCDRLAADGGGVPEVDEIGIRNTGEVVLLSTTPSAEPAVRVLGYRLVALLQDGNSPAPLRLFASQVTASSPLYSSLEDFSRGLAYFGRPERSRILQATYQRAVPVLASHAIAAGPQQNGRRGASPPDKPRHPVQGAKRQAMRFVLGAIAVAALGAASVAAWRRFDVGPTSAKLLSRTTASAATVVHAGVSSGMDLLRRAGLANGPRIAPPEATTPDTVPLARRRSQPARIEPEAVAESSGSVAAEPSSPGPGDLSVNRSASAPANSDTTSTGQRGTSPDNLIVDSRIYTADDTEVSLPVLTSPQQLPSLPPDTADPSSSAPGVLVVDLLINERGTVDSVKLITPRVDMRQRMLLSAVKAWRYQPALKNGRPVRFLHRVRLVS